MPELKAPYSALSGATPELRSSLHYFFKLSDPRCVAFLKYWTRTPGRLQPEVLNKISEWFGEDETGAPKLADWDISRDAPYFGIRIPDTEDKYFYVWLDAPIGYLASLKGLMGSAFDAYVADPQVEQVHFIGKDIVTFHTLFWPATLHFSGRKVPHHIFVHGFITVSGEKMSKSRGTGISPLRYLEIGLQAQWLRYYIAAKLNARVEDIDFNPDDFVARVNSDLWASTSTSPRVRRASSASASAAVCRRTWAWKVACCWTGCVHRPRRSPSCTRRASSARRCAR